MYIPIIDEVNDIKTNILNMINKIIIEYSNKH